jgi:hypothetical protein
MIQSLSGPIHIGYSNLHQTLSTSLDCMRSRKGIIIKVNDSIFKRPDPYWLLKLASNLINITRLYA